jgi:hypothetical protein
LHPPPNQALLEGISLSQPQPKIPPELIKFLGKSFNSWHIAIPLLESHVIIFPDESRCFDALAELYKQVRVGGGRGLSGTQELQPRGVVLACWICLSLHMFASANRIVRRTCKW